jgi:(p)ppGpp synthase/HD superfamily hydrolase
MISPLIEQALEVAAVVHRDQSRKGSDLPYIIHPVGVMWLAAEVTRDEATLCAALLHDVLEDGDPQVYDADDMQNHFGSDVLAIVQAVSKDAGIPDWRSRNEDYLRRVEVSGLKAAWIVCAADKVNNLTATLADYETLGDEVWSRFNAGKASQQWWYGACLELLERRLPGNALVTQLAQGVRRLQSL